MVTKVSVNPGVGVRSGLKGCVSMLQVDRDHKNLPDADHHHKHQR